MTTDQRTVTVGERITVQLVFSSARLYSTQKENMLLFVDFNPNLCNWRPPVQWYFSQRWVFCDQTHDFEVKKCILVWKCLVCRIRVETYPNVYKFKNIFFSHKKRKKTFPESPTCLFFFTCTSLKTYFAIWIFQLKLTHFYGQIISTHDVRETYLLFL